MNSTKKVDIGSSEQSIFSAFGQPNSMTLHDYEEQGVTAKFYIYIGLKLFVIQDLNSLNGFELTNLDYYIGKAGRLLIRVGDPISYLNQFVLLSYQNRDINKGCLFINLTTTNGMLQTHLL